MSDELCYLSAVEATQLFQNGDLSPVELVKAVIAQSERFEPAINAFSHTFFEEALEQARIAESKYAGGKTVGLLEGVPIAIKDEVDVRGQRNTEGSLIHRNRIAEDDAVLAARLRGAGAIFHARTTCPEFCTLWNTHSRLFGVTRNPWNLEITPGGSSGGSAASLAVGTTTLATGSDIGGSIRYPASMCGLVGFKPPYGRVPETYSPFNMEPYCANGPMARTVSDAALMQNVISGQHYLDAASTLPKVEIPLSFPATLAGQRIAFSMDFGYLEVEPDIAANTLGAVRRLRDLGAVVDEVSLDWPAGIEDAYWGHMDELSNANIAKFMETSRDKLCDYNVKMAEQGLARQRDPASYYNAARTESDMYAVFGKLMEHYDVFVCPTVTSTKLKADFNPIRDRYMVNDKETADDLMLSTCHIFNMMGRCPVISVPSGIADNGVPTGLQIASRAFDDVTVFHIAAALESTWDAPFVPALSSS